MGAFVQLPWFAVRTWPLTVVPEMLGGAVFWGGEPAAGMYVA